MSSPEDEGVPITANNEAFNEHARKLSNSMRELEDRAAIAAHKARIAGLERDVDRLTTILRASGMSANTIRDILK